ncbi:Calcium-activated potassium channel subunit alpha-1 [Perkinsus olseni]|uniref:Calcium-activated potassium channel subunit alpha-1 n=1 Tax=Perkinsus olseni TaxID=32597 RepID=A0A7J6LVV2_PEROL|nr:Calcium-activated potassium channel subunit alpha-1 [Perkinsus olseni]
MSATPAVRDDNGVVCGDDCAFPTLNNFISSLQLAGIIWFSAVCGSTIFFIVRKRLFSQRPGVVSGRIVALNNTVLASIKYNGVLIFFCSAYCILYVMRVQNQAAYEYEYQLELLICVVLAFFSLLQLAAATITSLEAAIYVWFSALIVDALIISSPVGLSSIEMAVLDEDRSSPGVVEFKLRKTWFSLCFLASIRIALLWRKRQEMVAASEGLENLKSQVFSIVISCFAVLFCFTCLIHVAEAMGADRSESSAREEAYRRGLDPNTLTADELAELGSSSVFWGSSLLKDYPAYDKWGVLTAVYFVCVTVSTVGYGDIAPDTVLGRSFTLLSVLSGIIGFSIATHHLAQVYMMNKRGGGNYRGIGSGHIVITGNPSAENLKAVLLEIFHPDHCVSDEPDKSNQSPEMRQSSNTPLSLASRLSNWFPKAAGDWGDRTPDVVVLLPHNSRAEPAIRSWLKEKRQQDISSKIWVLKGSVFSTLDMQQRCVAHRAKAFLILPPELMEIGASEAIREDTENVVGALKGGIQDTVNCHHRSGVCLEHKELITAAVLPSERIDAICLDALQLGIIGKNCQIPGFMTIVSNLCKTFGDDDLLLDDCVDEFGNARPPSNWLAEYDRGLSMELYEVLLSPVYSRKTFIQVADDIYNRNDKGSVILIGLVEFEEEDGRASRQVVLNPHFNHRIDPEKIVYGVFIAPSVNEIQQQQPAAARSVNRANSLAPAEDISDDYNDIEGGRMYRRLDPPRQEREIEEQELREIAAALLDPEERAQDFDRSLTAGFPVWDAALAEKVRSKEHLMKAEGARRGKVEAALNVVRAGKMVIEEAASSCGVTLDQLQSVYSKELGGHRESIMAELRATKPVYDGDDNVEGSGQAFIPPPVDVLVRGGHIVFLSVAGTGDSGKSVSMPLGIAKFVEPLRSQYTKQPRPIVVVASSLPKDWHEVRSITDVYFVEGNPVSPFDLSRAGVLSAWAIVIHQAPDNSLGDADGGENEMVDADAGDGGSSGGGLTGLAAGDGMTDPGGDMVDADAIFVVKLLEAQLDRTAPYRSESPRPMIFVELVKGENAKFIPLDPTSAPTRSADSRGSNYQLGIEVYRSPRYMSGSVFLNSVFSNLGVNILYNSSLLTLIEELITAPSLAVKISPEWAGRPFHVLYTFLLHRHNLTAIALKRVTPKRRSQAGRTSVTQGQRRSRSRNSRRSQAWIDTDFDEGFFLDMDKTGESGLWEALGDRIKRLMGELVETRRQRKPEPAPDEFIVTAPYADAILSVQDRVICLAGKHQFGKALPSGRP